MGFLDVAYNVVGFVSPEQLARIQAETAAGIEKASRGAAPAVIAERQRQARSEIDGVLRSSPAGSSHPEDVNIAQGVFDPLGRIVGGVSKGVGDVSGNILGGALKGLFSSALMPILLVVGLGVGGYFLFRFFGIASKFRRGR